MRGERGYSLVELLVAVSLLGIMISLIAGIHLFTARRLKSDAAQMAAIQQTSVLHKAITQLAASAMEIRATADGGIYITTGEGVLTHIVRDTTGKLLRDGIGYPTPNLKCDSLLVQNSNYSSAIVIAVSGDAGYIRFEVPYRKLSQWVERHSPINSAADSHKKDSR